MIKILTMTFLVTFSGCTRTHDSIHTNSKKPDSISTVDNITLDSLDFNIIRYDTSYKHIFPTTFKAAGLSEKEIIECESLLKSFIVNYNADGIKRFDEAANKYPNAKFNSRDFTIELKEYGRQYMSVVSDKGDKIVYINCFCDSAHFAYRSKELVVVMDGGNCFFNCKVNLTKKEIVDFAENGVA